MVVDLLRVVAKHVLILKCRWNGLCEGRYRPFPFATTVDFERTLRSIVWLNSLFSAIDR
jgi:hypothetical protein